MFQCPKLLTCSTFVLSHLPHSHITGMVSSPMVGSGAITMSKPLSLNCCSSASMSLRRGDGQPIRMPRDPAVGGRMGTSVQSICMGVSSCSGTWRNRPQGTSISTAQGYSQVKIVVGGGGGIGNSYPVSHFSTFQYRLAMRNVVYGANPRLRPRQMCLYEPSNSDFRLHLHEKHENRKMSWGRHFFTGVRANRVGGAAPPTPPPPPLARTP